MRAYVSHARMCIMVHQHGWLATVAKEVGVAAMGLYTALVLVKPPNITKVSSVSDVRVKRSQGGGQSPLTIGEIH